MTNLVYRTLIKSELVITFFPILAPEAYLSIKLQEDSFGPSWQQHMYISLKIVFRSNPLDKIKLVHKHIVRRYNSYYAKILTFLITIMFCLYGTMTNSNGKHSSLLPNIRRS